MAVPHPRSACVCGQRGGLSVARVDRFGLPLRTVVCPACRTVRSRHVIAEDRRTEFYARLYPILHPGLEYDRAARERRQADWISRRCPLAGRGLEVGGRAMRHASGARWDEYDVAAPSQIERGYDLVVALHVLEHCTDPVASLRAWSCSLAEGGSMIVAVPDLLEVHHHRLVATYGLAAWWHLAHVWNWSASNVLLPFIRAGLCVYGVTLVAPGTLATVGSLVVAAQVERRIMGYVGGCDA